MLYFNDCIEQLKAMEPNSIDAIVTDPPYGWRFMGKAWDGEDIDRMASSVGRKDKSRHDGKKNTEASYKAQAAGAYDLSFIGNSAFQSFSKDWAHEALRVLKPGGHMLVFCGPRTYHRMASGVEDAGFEIRDQLQWLFGSGFPKSLDISKAIDKAAGAEREKIQPGNQPAYQRSIGNTRPWMDDPNHKIDGPDAITDDAKKWQGFGTALKPANEPILLARKPLSEKTVASNVLKWGTGGLNIDAGRIGYQSPSDFENAKGGNTGSANRAMSGWGLNTAIPQSQKITPTGRFPANLILDEEAAAALDEQTGNLGKSSGGNSTNVGNKVYGKYNASLNKNPCGFGDTGGASRFFYVAKASKRDKGLGNSHPTVKPTRLMEYLIKLITPPNGIVLDPFMGSGSTGVAAIREGFTFIGIERDPVYFEIAKSRVEEAKAGFELGNG